jgi:hypothetical protein
MLEPAKCECRAEQKAFTVNHLRPVVDAITRQL